MDEPWDRMPTESPQAYQAARLYFELGNERSQEAVARKLSKSRQLMTRWATQHSWLERSELYDAHLRGVALKAAESTIAEEAAKWARRQYEQRERDYIAADMLRQKAEKMLSFPLQRTTTQVTKTKDGTLQQTIVEPARWTFRTALAAMELASRLARLATGMPVDPLDVDWESLTDEEIDDIIQGRIPRRLG